MPVAVSGGVTFAAVRAGDESACGITADGGAYCWGLNAAGSTRCGTADELPGLCNTVPAALPGGGSWAALSLGFGSCGLTTEGAAYCWDYPGIGRSAIGGGLTFATISTGNGFACGLTTGGVAYCWGINNYGQLGNGTTEGSGFSAGSVPSRVAGQR